MSRLLETQEVDAVLHTVGAFSYQPIDACDPGTWRSMMSSNLDSAFYAYHFCEKRSETPWSLDLLWARWCQHPPSGADLSAYAAAKSGLMSLVSSIARVEAPFGVTCNVMRRVCCVPRLKRSADFESRLAGPQPKESS